MDSGARTITIVGEGETTPRQLNVTEALAIGVSRAVQVNVTEKYVLSFASLFAGILFVEDRLSRWQLEYFSAHHVDAKTLLEREDLSWRSLGKRFDEAPRFEPLASPLPATARATRVLLQAESARMAASGEQSLDIRHVLATYAAWKWTRTAPSFRKALPEWLDALGHELREQYPAEASFWSGFIDGARRDVVESADGLWSAATVSPTAPAKAAGQTLWGFAPDVYSQHDLIGIDREVNGLAALIASHKTSLPLSIGLFGQWGSGKTFFIRHLQGRIREISARAAASAEPQSKVAYFKHIAQIEFNAWHYSEGQLLASLVEHILQNLATSPDEQETEQAERQAALLTALMSSRREQEAADERLRVAKEQVANKEAEIKSLEQRQEVERKGIAEDLSRLVTLGVVRQAVALDETADANARAALEKIGVTGLGAAAHDLQAALTDAQRELTGLNGLVASLLHGRGRGVRIFWLAVALAAPIVVGAVAYALLRDTPQMALIGQWIARIVAFVAAADVWIRKQTAWVAARRREIDVARTAVDRAIEEQTRKLQADQTAQLAVRLNELERLRVEQAGALRDRDERARSISALETALARTSSTFLLNEFIMDRARADDYRRLLGFMALIRRDFDKLSTLITGSNTALLKGEPIAGVDPRLNRIVLYIDDLDRCPEDRVVEVLRAVHLLLAFPLFVVVVAVDSRWLTRCLIEHYPKIFGASDPATNATPLDYLEKIFQIPLWLPPLAPEKRVKIVRALLDDAAAEVEIGPGAKDDAPAPSPASTRSDDSPPPQPPPVQPVSTPATPSPAPVAGTPAADRHKPHSGAKVPVDLDPRGLSITDGERQFIDDLAPILSQSPRVLKRLANTYRLIKGGLPDDDLHQFVDDASPQFRPCLFQLSVLLSMPAFAPSYLHAMKVLSAFTEGSVGEWLVPLAEPRAIVEKVEWFRSEDRGSWLRLASFLRGADAPAIVQLRQLPLPHFAEWAPRVARYTFTPE